MMNFSQFSLAIFLVSFTCLFILPLPAQSDLSARDIVQKSNEKVLGRTSLSDMTMEIIRPDWSRSMSMQAWTLGQDYEMVLITAPAREKGQVFLKRESNMWNWLPQIGRMIKIPPSMMMQSWLGSDFTNNDLMRINSLVEDYQHEILDSDTVEGYDCYKIQLTPKPEAPVVWGKVIMWVSKGEFFQNRVEYYDEDLKLVNVLTGTEMRRMDDRVIPTKLTMTVTTKPGHRTVVTTGFARFNEPLDKDFFSAQMMKRLRPRSN